MYRAAADASAAIVGAKRERIFTTRYAQIIPIEIVRASFIADPVSLRIPERTGFQPDDAKSCTRQSLEQHSARRTDPNDAVVNFLSVLVAAHWHIDALSGSEHVILWWSLEGAEKRFSQCVPPWPGLAL